jgi:hypothetical protein
MYVKLSWRPEVLVFISGALHFPEKYEKPICVITRNIVRVLASHFNSVIGNFRSSGWLVCQAILETGSGRKLSHNGCTADNFYLPDHGFLLLTWSTGPMEWSTGNCYQAEALTNILRYHQIRRFTCFHPLPVPMAARITKYLNKYVRMVICLIYMSSFYFWSPPL